MKRGTTPLLKFKTPYKASLIDHGYATISRKGVVFMEIPFSDNRISVQDGFILISLSQEDTLKFNSRATYSVQLRIVLRGDVAVASNIITVPIGSILKNGVI